MERTLFPRLLGGAIVLSVLLLCTAWYFGDPGPQEAARATAELEGSDLPGRFDAVPDDNRANPLQRVERSTFLTEQNGKQTALSWEVLTPRTDFVSDVERPRARVELGPGRVLVLEAAEGTVEHPGNDFQRGNFRGGTVATFHRLEGPGTPLSNATAVLRLLLDGPTTFDRELGRLSTGGRVRVTGPRVDLVGEGLELDFSRADEEVKHLLLDRTDRLRLRRDAEPTASAGPPPPSAGPRAGGADPQPDRVSETTPDTGESLDAAAPRPTVYRVEASGSVQVDSDNGGRLTGENLLLFFAAAEGIGTPAADREEKQPGTATVRGAGGDPPASGSTADVNTGTDADAEEPDPSESESLFRPGPGTVELSWTGPLQLRPATAEEGPAEVHDADFRGAHLRLKGTPGTPATAASGEARISAGQLAYATEDGRLTAVGGPGTPVLAEEPAAGRLRARRVEATPDDGLAVATGPGELRASDPEAGADAPEALVVSFQESMRLNFDPAEGGGDRGVALRQAVFSGSVSVVAAAAAGGADPDATADANGLDTGGGPLTLDASRVTLSFTPGPASGTGSGNPVPESLLAEGGVSASRASGDPGAPPAWTLASEDLRVALAPSAADPTRPEIDGLEATGGVVVETSGATPATPPGGPSAPATQNAPAEPLRLHAERLVASPKLDRVELNGTADAPATAVRGGVTLTGATVVAGLTGQRLEVRGAGTLDRLTPAGEATRLTWTDSLRYDGTTGQAEALGETLTTSESSEQRRRIEAGDVRASFDPEDDANGGEAGAGGGFAGLRQLRAAAPEAGGNPQVVVVTETLDPDGGVAATLRAEGPRLDLDVLPENEGGRQLLTMPGPGRLILVDDGPTSPTAGEAAVRLAGRGATFFRWNDALRLDGRTRDAELTGAVFMNHDPRDGGPRVKLYGDRLLASFGEQAATGAPPADAGRPELRSVRIDGNVVVEQEERTITADHLAFRTGTDEVQLWSNAGRGMAITAGGQTLQAGNATWNLQTDRVDVRGVGGSSAPLPPPAG